MITVHRQIADIPRDEWNALVGEGSPFLEWDFLRALEATGRVGGHTGWWPRHLALWSGGNGSRRLAAAVPLYAKAHSHGEFVYDWSWAEAAQRLGRRYYPKLVAAVPFSPVAGARLLVAPGEDRPARMRELLGAIDDLAQEIGAASFAVLFPDVAEADELEALGLSLRPGVRHRFRNEGYASWDDFLRRFTSKRRAQIRRERAQLAKNGVQFETLVGDQVTPPLVGAMHDYYRVTVDKYPWGHPYLNRAFFAQLVASWRERLHVVVARRDDRIVGMSINATKGDALYGRYWGGDEGIPFLHFAACFYEPIAWCIEHGVQSFDPGAGGEHKAPRGFLAESQPSAHRIYDPVLAPLLDRAMARERSVLDSELGRIRDEDSPFKRA